LPRVHCSSYKRLGFALVVAVLIDATLVRCVLLPAVVALVARRAAPGRSKVGPARDIVPIGYAAFALVLGASAGALIRRTLPAMATTLVSFVVARIVFTTLVRPRLIAPLHRGFALDPNGTGFGSSGSLVSGAGHAALQPNPPDIPNGWIYSTDIVDKAGRPLTSQVLKSDCPLLGTSGPPAGGTHSGSEVPNGVQQVLHDCVVKVGATYHGVATYQPGSRYWNFQWSETAIFLGAALVLAGLCFWWVRRRVT
jgi:hypothetical protein